MDKYVLVEFDHWKSHKDDFVKLINENKIRCTKLTVLEEDSSS